MKPKANRQSVTTTNDALDQALVLLLQTAQMIQDILAAPKLVYKPALKDHVKRIHEKARYLTKFAKR